MLPVLKRVSRLRRKQRAAGPGFEPSATDPESGIVRTMLVPSYYHLRHHLCGWVHGDSWRPNDIFSRANPVNGGRKGPTGVYGTTDPIITNQKAQLRGLSSALLKFLQNTAEAKSPGFTPRLFDACVTRSEEHTSELQSRQYLVCRLLLEKKK